MGAAAKAPVPKATPLLSKQVIAPVEVNVQSPLMVTGAYAVPPALPAGICPAAGEVFGMIAALVWEKLVTLLKPIDVGVTEIAPAVFRIEVPSGLTPPKTELVAVGNV